MNDKIILTGAMGAGKSTLINELRKQHITCVDEPARQILAEQRAINGDGVPETNPQRFCERLLERAIEQYQRLVNSNQRVIFDRGIADTIAYFQLFELDPSPALQAAKHYRYHHKVLFLPAWEAIYSTDEERKMSFEQARQCGEALKSIYQQLDYELIEIPMLPPEPRAKHIIHIVNDFFN